MMTFKTNLNVVLKEELKIIKSQMSFKCCLNVCIYKLIKFKRNLNVLFRERLKIQKGPKLFSTISRSAVDEMIHLNAFKCI